MTKWLTFAPVLVAVAGCQGIIGDNSPEGADGTTVETRNVAPEPLHRLNRLEYDNTVRDLLGVTITPAQDFPPDSATEGFDNLADGLSLSPSLMDLYYTASRNLTKAALNDTPRYTQRVDARPHAAATQQLGTPFDWGWSLTRQGSRSLDLGSVTLPEEEAVTISILAGGDHTPDPRTPVPDMTLMIDGAAAQTWTVTASPTAPAAYTLQTTLAPGDHTLSVVFSNGFDQPAENVYNTLVVGYVDVTSDTRVTPPGRAMLYVCDPTKSTDSAGCHRKILTRFVERAWRRPLTAQEIEDVFSLWKELAATEGDEMALSLVVRGILVSSQFLYRPSFTGVALGGGFDGAEGLEPLDDYTLASRLSYFLWSSMPDEALFEAAKLGQLRTDEGLRAQVTRMIADPKASALRKGFAAQWLGTRKTASAQPDATRYPMFDEPLRAAMIAEAELFFDDFLRNGRPMSEMFAPDFGYLNDRLATHYGMALPGSDEVKRVKLSPGDRRGLLTQGAWITATSSHALLVPPARGRWILEQLLCIVVPPPPPGVPQPVESNAPVREKLRLHREDPSCQGCHDLIDPAGLGMEEFDVIGARQTMDGGQPVDPSGAIPGGSAFVGAAQLASILQQDRRVPDCITEKLMTYALGRSLEAGDKAFLSDITDQLPLEGDSVAKAIELIVLSPAFRMRGPKGAE